MTDSDKLSSKNKQIMDNIEKSLQTDKDKTSDKENLNTATSAQSANESTKTEETSDVNPSASEKMTDKNSKQHSANKKSASAETSSKPHSKNNTSSTKSKSNSGLWFITVINFLLVAGVIGAGYWYYTQIASDESQQQTEFNSLNDNINLVRQELSSDLQSSEAKLNALQQSFDKELQTTQALVEQLQNSINANSKANAALADQLAQVSGRRPSDWLLAEANYLVNMAGRKLYLEKDIRTAMTLLKEADARLVDLNDPSLFPVRALIAADIQTLNQINPTSTSSIALAIGGMLPKVSNLPLDTLQIPESTANQDLTLSEDIADWQENLSRTWKSIVGDLITIDRVDQPLEPYLAERQQWLIEQQLKHSLSQAQTAALNEQVTLFKTTMQQAISLIVEHYKLDDTGVSQFLVALQELQNTDFDRNYPEKLESQVSLSDLIKRRLQGLYNNQLNEDSAPSEGNSL